MAACTTDNRHATSELQAILMQILAEYHRNYYQEKVKPPQPKTIYDEMKALEGDFQLVFCYLYVYNYLYSHTGGNMMRSNTTHDKKERRGPKKDVLIDRGILTETQR